MSFLAFFVMHKFTESPYSTASEIKFSKDKGRSPTHQGIERKTTGSINVFNELDIVLNRDCNVM